MERLWSPWRSQYISSVTDGSENGESPFTRAYNQPERDDDNFLLFRGHRAFIILNRYPYNAGHLLVVPVREIADFLELDDDERHEIMDLAAFGVRVLKEALAPDAFNIGMNLGRTAGAAVAGHVHMHIVPRWNGDTNFMPVLSDTRHISEYMHETFTKLKDAMRGMKR